MDHLCLSLAAGPVYNPAANLLKMAPAEVQRQAETVLGYGSDRSEPLNSARRDARQEIHDFAHYMPTRVLELEQRINPYSFPAGQAAAIHEQVRHAICTGCIMVVGCCMEFFPCSQNVLL